VTDNQRRPVSDEQFGTDLEYDLAHEASYNGMTARAENEGQPVTVATDTPGYDGDYSYDLAHDIPGRKAP